MFSKLRKFNLQFLLFFCFISLGAFAQEYSYKANYTIGPARGALSNDSHNLEYLISVLSDYGQQGNVFSHQSPFELIPSVQILSENRAGEVQVVKVYKLEIAITTQGIDDRFKFHSFKRNYTITAPDQSTAITKAIAETQKKSYLENYFDLSNKSILDFYQKNCQTILNSVKLHMDRKEYQKAYNQLIYMPEGVSCYGQAENIITNIFSKAKEQSCQILAQKAHSAYAALDYQGALDYLKYVDPTTSCYKDVFSLVEQIAQKVDKGVLREFEMDKLKFETFTDLKKLEIIVEHTDVLSVSLDL